MDLPGPPEIERLLHELLELEKRRTVLLSELQDFAAMLPEIRSKFGNPFFYSRPAEPDESIEHYTGFNSHDVGLPTILGLRRVDRKIERIKKRLRELGATTP